VVGEIGKSEESMIKKKLQTLKTIETELNRRLKRMKTSTINIKIALSNNDTKALGVVADDYTKVIDENMRMLSTMDRILADIEGLLEEEN
jgi:hypothetical protein